MQVTVTAREVVDDGEGVVGEVQGDHVGEKGWQRREAERGAVLRGPVRHGVPPAGRLLAAAVVAVQSRRQHDAVCQQNPADRPRHRAARRLMIGVQALNRGDRWPPGVWMWTAQETKALGGARISG